MSEALSDVVVMKFGGTSVATPEARAVSALKVIGARERGLRPVVVVSAIGRRGAPYATDTLLGVLREVDPAVEPDPRELDLMIACGEILSAVIFAHTLKTLGHPGQAFRGGQAGIRTDGVYGNARILSLNPTALFRSIEAGKIPVVCGFQGVFVTDPGLPGGELTTLGRGGSDTTAAAVGAAMGARAVEIYTDVDGVKTADPDAVKDAPTLRRVTYDEVAEIAHLGAKVVHPRAAEIAMAYGIPLWVKSAFSDDEGTEIVARDAHPGRRATGVTHTGKLVYIQFDLATAERAHRAGLEARIYETMERYGLPLFMLNVSPSSTGFAVPRDRYPVVADVLDGLVVPVGQGPLGASFGPMSAAGGAIYLFQIGDASPEVETQAQLLSPLGRVRRVVARLTEGTTMVSLVGHEFMQQPGLYASVLETLAGAGIAALQTSDSEFSLSVLVAEGDQARAVRLLHERFGLSDVR